MVDPFDAAACQQMVRRDPVQVVQRAAGRRHRARAQANEAELAALWIGEESGGTGAVGRPRHHLHGGPEQGCAHARQPRQRGLRGRNGTRRHADGLGDDPVRPLLRLRFLLRLRHDVVHLRRNLNRRLGLKS